MMQPKVNKEKVFYQNTPLDQVSNYQLNTFNNLWKEIQQNVPYYQKLVLKDLIPEKINRWGELLKIPIQNREYDRDNIFDFSDKTRQADKYVTTGGSTGTHSK